MMTNVWTYLKWYQEEIELIKKLRKKKDLTQREQELLERSKSRLERYNKRIPQMLDELTNLLLKEIDDIYWR